MTDRPDLKKKKSRLIHVDEAIYLYDLNYTHIHGGKHNYLLIYNILHKIFVLYYI